MAALAGQMVAQRAARKDCLVSDETVAECGSEDLCLVCLSAGHCLVMQRRSPMRLLVQQH